MILTQEDLQKIENKGFSKTDFCLDPKDVDGFWQLKNINEQCYFLSDKEKCTIYNIRPRGCRLYP